ncbi:hypothetical protein PSQ90_14940 [Devosia rhodophyticola]|uniref:Uncharacterized protein n=1 Tax=Devosia rhodophyticola TaxID=3026423 RepID=A0ABY7YW16_9HYPH|nr:hypothetical protein [Devosia rhodophyticola]WDR05553.1 hypothetical protein PSQ90_14940 [Devosia rhodophyticola]
MTRLYHPVSIVGGALTDIIIRPPNRSVFKLKASTRLGNGFTDPHFIRFAAWLSGFSEATIAYLSNDDRFNLRHQLETEFQNACRRFRTGRAVAKRKRRLGKVHGEHHD